MKRSLLVAAVLLSAQALAQAPVIQISGANFRPLPMAVAHANADAAVPSTRAKEFDDALVFDLSAAGIFQLLDRKSFLADAKEGMTAGSINFARWTDVGAEALVKTQLAVEGGNLRGELRLFSVGGGKEDLKFAQSVPVGDARRLSHLFADALYKHFTRETGPFGSRITFVRKNGANKDVLLADWDGRNPQVIASGTINLLPALGPNGVLGYTSYKKGHPDLYILRGGQTFPIQTSGQMSTGIAFSPDGKKIAYSVASGESAQVWTASADGSSPVQLTNTPFFINSSPTWSPDSKRLAFVSNRGGSPQVYVMGAGGGEARRLTFQGNYNQTPSWSPRGDLIAFTARDERNAFDLFTINVETSKVTRLTQDQGNNEEPTFSPNGRLILFTSTRAGASSLYVMTFEGNNQMPLPVEKGQYTTPDWGR
ncbi:MAG: DPP IV N-terminal domain-containing protein [Myxococcaceae bacterium]